MSVLPLPHSLQECSAVASSRCLRFGGKWHWNWNLQSKQTCHQYII
jgi:hypothetical protein